MDHPLRTASGVEKVPRRPCPASLERIGIETAVREPLRTPSCVQKVPRLPCHASLERKIALKDHLRTPFEVGKVPRLPCPASLERIETALRDPLGPGHPLLRRESAALASRKCCASLGV